MKKTYNIKLLTSSQEDLASVLEIFKLHQSVYNYMSDGQAAVNQPIV